MPHEKKCCGRKRYEAVLYVLGILLIVNSLFLLEGDLISALLSAVAGLLLIPRTAVYAERVLPPLKKPQLRFLIIIVCVLVLTARTEPYRQQEAQSDTGLWSTVCLKDCEDEQGSRTAQMLDDVRDCGVLRDMYDVTPGSIGRMQWVRMVRARARMLDCPNI